MASQPVPATPLPQALSWYEARSRLRTSLSSYVADTSSSSNRADSDARSTRRQVSFCHRWVASDVDVLLGAMGSAVVILVFAVITFVNPSRLQYLELFDDPRYAINVNEQLAASILLFLGSLINVWLITRRRHSNLEGNDSLKRREIARFLRKSEKQQEECWDRSINSHGHYFNQPSPLDLLGSTSLTGVYPVYRTSSHRDGPAYGGAWRRLPTLLLVQGDHIALQIGDIAPAACKLLSTNRKLHIELQAGQTINLNTFKESSSSMAAKWPKGRTTLPEDSEFLSNLCNNMQIYEVLETPVEAFLRQPRKPSKKPQISRQIGVIREFLSLMGLLFFLSTLAIVLARSEMTPEHLLVNLPVPFLAAAASFPLILPACLIVIEMLGTARILASYHPVAVLDQESSGSNSNLDLLLLRYFLATAANRLALQDLVRKLYNILNAMYQLTGAQENLTTSGPNLVTVPPVSLNLLEKLGVSTAFTLIDDELVCEPQAVPQQLLIPSAKGLKLLDLCPTYEDESDDEQESDSFSPSRRNDYGVHDSDSDSDGALVRHHHPVPSRKKRRRLLRKAHKALSQSFDDGDSDSSNSIDHEVQFEDPVWWQHLPSLKCIGLACLLVDEKKHTERVITLNSNPAVKSSHYDFHQAKLALSRHICEERRTMQLRSLAQCIGFSTKPNRHGDHGDTSFFVEKRRIHVISASRVKARLEIDAHERSSEDSRWWGLLRPDSTSVIIQDTRNGSYQLLTVGDPRVVSRMCSEAWQGENSTILPLSAHDRAMVLETSKGWRLSDLDSEAFSYAPIPNNYEILTTDHSDNSKMYLLDNDPRGETLLPPHNNKVAMGDWSLLQNQIFLGVLGSCIIPRQETQGLLSTLQDAGVRFVFMSPRNMRLTKEIAAQMGIDIAWNCAISLRPLQEGEEDEHRMISNYADWDVNAKLPHGIESVKRHLKEVDNVPLLVSLFTDVTKVTTMQMIETFQDYNDTVIAVGLSHLPWNSNIFNTADLGVGVDILTDSLKRTRIEDFGYNSILPSEILFVSSISAHACAFRLRGVESISYMPTILAQGRASLEAATAATLFVLSGGLSYAFFVLFSVCSVARAIPIPEALGAFISLQVMIPLLGLTMTLSDADKKCMHRVPPKNDVSVVFGKREGKALFLSSVLKALPPAIYPQLLYLIALGNLLIHLEPEFVEAYCPAEAGSWTSIIRCEDVRDYVGPAKNSAVVLSLGGFLLGLIVVSAGFVHRTLPLRDEQPWKRNFMWLSASSLSLIIAFIYIGVATAEGALGALPWYFYIIALICPFLCLGWVEYVKRIERSVLDRAEKLRRLQFETRLGMWSPK
eukprot:Nitzschia sp. Nitz4//scaffold4_size323378//53271//57502//NITZ4_000626-RA/size323378-processed-gene-0.176-mRNA-1//-1//CDS//3329553297//2222//frame0